jgi:hypothetical protein
MPKIKEVKQPLMLAIKYEDNTYCNYTADVGSLVLHDSLLGAITFQRNLPIKLAFKNLNTGEECVGTINEILTLLQK